MGAAGWLSWKVVVNPGQQAGCWEAPLVIVRTLAHPPDGPALQVAGRQALGVGPLLTLGAGGVDICW